ncbi:MAG: hypothetical protein K9M51_03875 [Candidatus Gracilibacteria bacterium]|nr:hypothetical protein [Candidatus Gracilibacteria bacterium]
MSQNEKSEFIARNYEISIDRVFNETEPDGYKVTYELFIFFEKINTFYTLDEKENFDLFVKYILDTYQDCEYSFQDDFIQGQWLEFINGYFEKFKISAIKELVFYASQAINYWEHLSLLKFSIDHLSIDEKLVKSLIEKVVTIILKDWSKKDENWKRYAEEYLETVNSKGFDDTIIKSKLVLNALESFNSEK